MSAFAPVRRTVRQVHLWIGLGLGTLIFPVTLSGTLLLFDTEIDRFLNPSLYAVSGVSVTQPASLYLDHAAAFASGEAIQLRWPAETGLPVTVLVRARDPHSDAPPEDGARHTVPPALLTVYLDPRTAKVLGTADFRASFVGTVRRFHDSLLVPLSGRQIVGFVGMGLLFLCLTGLWIWWPRNVSVLRGLRWRRGPKVSFNLHHMTGFWIAIPLAIMAITGMYQAFPQQGRVLLGLLAPLAQMDHPPDRAAPLLRRKLLDPQRALDLALACLPGSQPLSLALPSAEGKAWQLRMVGDNGAQWTVMVDDTTATAVVGAPPMTGDAIGALMRRLHAGRYHGPVWRGVLLLCGLFPTILLVTGIMMWLRRRSNPSAASGIRIAGTVAAAVSDNADRMTVPRS
ncbi:MAG TPA: PepSY-associated TM helix domain-containing protein [Methylocella sp.]|nr:PepSY-associated TM helix domain-containing protein [Methylocella sp.]